MSTVEEIERAVERLDLVEFTRLAAWINTRRHDLWKKQMDRDGAGGKLDFLFIEAETERAGRLHDWPSDKE